VIFVMIFMFNLDNLSYGTYIIKTKNIISIIHQLEGDPSSSKQAMVPKKNQDIRAKYSRVYGVQDGLQYSAVVS